MFTEIYDDFRAALRDLTGGDPLAAGGLAAWSVLSGTALLAIIAIVLALEPVR